MTESSLFQGVRLLQNKHGRPDADVSSNLARLPHSSGSPTAELTGLRGVEEWEKVERLEGRMVNAKSQGEANRGNGNVRSSPPPTGSPSVIAHLDDDDDDDSPLRPRSDMP